MTSEERPYSQISTPRSAVEERTARLLYAELAAIQEEFLADAHEKGYDGTQTHLYKLIVALRRFAARDES